MSAVSAARAPHVRTARRASGRTQMSQVADLAGVSTATVSRVLRNPGVVSEALRTRVTDAVSELGYVPNRMAGGLAAARTHTVGVIVPSLSNSFFAATIEAMAERFEPYGYQIMLGNSGYLIEREEALVSSFLSWSPSAIVLTGQHHSRNTLKRLVNADLPVVEMWELGENPLDSAVGFSHRAAGQAAALHLLARGWRRLGFVGAALGQDRRANQRRAGFLETVAGSSGALAGEHSIAARASVEAGGGAMAALIAAHPDLDAVFFSNDVLMVGALFECQRRGLRVPADVALIGFGDFDFAACSVPTLSTIRPPRSEIGSAVADHLLRRFGHPDVRGETLDLGFELIAREST